MSTLKAGVIGWPIEQSKSPILHGYWLEQNSIDGVFSKIAATPEDFEATVRRLMADGWRGSSVTLPHKGAAMAVADEVTASAKAIGAANTLIFDGGRIISDNTDWFGFIENLMDRAGDQWRSDEPVMIFGAGGAARAAIFALIDAGVPEIRLLNRTKSKAETLAEVFGPKVVVHDWENQQAALKGAALIVNTTSLGMIGQPPLEIDFSDAPSHAVATDAVYVPLETPFLKSAAKAGLTTVDGLGMLIHQGRPSFRTWFGAEPTVDDTLRQLLLNA